ncbi:MAG: hypothetical protein AVDCRST_MAG56-7116 [uncultured Cytophagales bacterium]|uniref:Uncharacterized protein n=1 Tax=uncultured Cytophagales bacterium TaxID=158755 RepID=A0A6J4LAJ5_9SPHI|nr:MAG: hypothetical protein AVDCRST_MAG56-7116 [uncultured Cytophagales bacterium]
MLSRMLIYHAFLHYQRRMPIRQYVVYFGKEKLNMESRLASDSLTYQYQLVDLRTFPYQTFLQSAHGQEVLLAILADFGEESPALIAGQILLKLRQVSESELQLAQRVLQLVRLAVLRNLSTTVFNAAQHMALHIDIKEDALYQLGKEATALNLLKEGFPPEAVARLTELPFARIMQLKLELDASRKES